MRGFSKVSKEEFVKKRLDYEYQNIKMPVRSTKKSAGYDFYIPYDVVLKAHQFITVATGIKAYMEDDEFLMIVIRSSLGFKKGLRLKNQVGIIDSDYYDNIDNEGHILIALENSTDIDVELKKDDRIAQGIFLKYLTCKETSPGKERSGGIGSTN